MSRLIRLPARIPADTKYVLEARGTLIHRHLEFADGRTIKLSPRKAATCHCADTALVPDMSADAATERQLSA